MRLPVRHVAGNIVWTTHGTCWAIWRVAASNYSHAPSAAKKARLQALESLVKALVGEPMLLSLCPQVDPVAVVRAMVADVDLAASPRYERLGHAVLDELEAMELTGRTDWLAVPLPAFSRRDAVASLWSAAKAELDLQLGLLPAAITADEIERRTGQARGCMPSGPPGWRCAPPTRPRSCGSTGTVPGAASSSRCSDGTERRCAPRSHGRRAERGGARRGRHRPRRTAAGPAGQPVQAALPTGVQPVGRLPPGAPDVVRNAGDLRAARGGVPAAARRPRLPRRLGGPTGRHPRREGGGEDPPPGTASARAGRRVRGRPGRPPGDGGAARGRQRRVPGAADRLRARGGGPGHGHPRRLGRNRGRGPGPRRHAGERFRRHRLHVLRGG